MNRYRVEVTAPIKMVYEVRANSAERIREQFEAAGGEPENWKLVSEPDADAEITRIVFLG